MSRRRIDVWLPEHEWRAVDEAAAAAGVETGAVARLAIIRAFHGVCRDVEAGRIRLRRRSKVEQPDRFAGLPYDDQPFAGQRP